MALGKDGEIVRTREVRYWVNDRERDLAELLGFVVYRGETLHMEGSTVSHTSPASARESALWDALMTPERNWGRA